MGLFAHLLIGLRGGRIIDSTNLSMYLQKLSCLVIAAYAVSVVLLSSASMFQIKAVSCENTVYSDGDRLPDFSYSSKIPLCRDDFRVG
jgi:hypothetical protein